MHHVWNDIALIYHKIYETCTFFLMSFMQILLHPLFAPLKKKVPSQKLLCQKASFTFIDICPSLLILTTGGGRRGAGPSLDVILQPGCG